MTALKPRPASATPAARPQLLQFLRAALSHATAPLVAVTILLGSARILPILLNNWLLGDVPLDALNRLPPAEIVAGCMLLAVLIAEQCVRNGVRRLNAYLPAVIVAAAVAGLISALLILFLAHPDFPVTQANGQCTFAGVASFISADALARGGLAAFIYANRESWVGSVRKFHAAELERARVERDLAHSHLLAAQATIQPEALIATLKAVDTLYERDRAEADRSLAKFIEHLRSIALAAHA